jgi:hypothetical protein
MKMKRPLILLTLMLTATLASFAIPAHAGFMGDFPVVTFGKDGNVLDFIEVGNIRITKGIGVAGFNSGDWFLELTAVFTDKKGDPVAVVDPMDIVLQVDKHAESNKGAVLVLPVTLVVDETVSDSVKEVLDKGNSVFCTTTVNLVHVDGKGGNHVLDTVVSESIEIKPEVPAPEE